MVGADGANASNVGSLSDFGAWRDALHFGWELDNTGKPIVGNGFDEKSFIGGLSMNALV
ncbi:hypothetical protein L916_20934, partial [Phytophthora nicotianae]